MLKGGGKTGGQGCGRTDAGDTAARREETCGEESPAESRKSLIFCRAAAIDYGSAIAQDCRNVCGRS